jgi:hypothetical protein
MGTSGNGTGPATPGPFEGVMRVPGLPAGSRTRFAAKLLLAELPLDGGFLLLALHARLFIMFAPSRLSQDAILLDALVEALERALKRLAIADDDFSQG